MKLYSQATRSSWLDLFQLSTKTTNLCNHQFVVEDENILAFFTLNTDQNKTSFSSPETLLWRPETHYLTTENCYQQFTKSLIAKPIHLMLRLPNEATYTYVGIGNCYSYSFPSTQTTDEHFLVEAQFSLQHWLPRDLWVLWGGYQAWNMTFNGEEKHVSTWEEIKPYALHLYESHDKQDHLVLERYEGDLLSIATADDKAVFIYQFTPSDSVISSRNLSISRTNYELIDFFVYGGHHSQLPSYYFIPKTQLLLIVRQFIEQGSLTHLIRWESD